MMIDDVKVPPFRQVKMKTEIWQDAKDMADELQAERGGTVSIADAIAEALRALREKRDKSKVA